MTTTTTGTEGQDATLPSPESIWERADRIFKENDNGGRTMVQFSAMASSGDWHLSAELEPFSSGPEGRLYVSAYGRNLTNPGECMFLNEEGFSFACASADDLEGLGRVFLDLARGVRELTA